MKRDSQRIPAAVFVLLLLAFGCSASENRLDLAERMAAQENPADDDARISELKGLIRSSESQVERTIEAVRDKGTYWRLLGLKYMDFQMWGEALNALNEAVAIYPDMASLHYDRGLCASQMAMAANTTDERLEYLSMAAADYERSLDIDPRRTDAMYALSVILVFELNRPFEALPLLREYLTIERSDVPARFLLARVHLLEGRPGEAMALYGEITRLVPGTADAAKADEFYARAAGGDYGS